MVGFAAETGDLRHHAHRKCREKNCDLVCANDVSKLGSGFGSDDNEVVLCLRDGTELALGLLNKENVANRILDVVAPMLKRT